MTPEQTQAIEASCTKLIYRYAQLNDAGHWPEVAALFAADGIMARPGAPDVDIVGREAILAAFLARPARASVHICSNVIVTVVNETQASATSLILLFSGNAPDDGGLPTLDANSPKVGAYTDHFTLTAEGWRFAARRGRMLFR